jgi:S-disulfanyl-L-cysteine oxidoreductase SoxD
MFKFFERPFASAAVVTLVALAGLGGARAVDDFAGVGRPVTQAELKAWNIDVRPDFLGLPKGSGTVERGQELWESKCASCHGTFGESNSVFTPLVGGVDKGDLATGHVAALKRTDYPARTTFMKVATISTLFDYIRRAMPWNAPKSLSDDDVYAVLAYLLNLSEIVPDDFTLDDQTIRDVQKIMPNRNGMTTQHALWPSAALSGKPLPADTRNAVCMTACKSEAEIVSVLPDHALNSHGNLADQNRRVGPVRGQVTGPSEETLGAADSPIAIAETAGCLGCHAPAARVVGPSYVEVAEKYKGQDAAARLAAKVRQGGEGVWGDVAMPPQEDIKDDDLNKLIAWILQAAPGK